MNTFKIENLILILMPFLLTAVDPVPESHNTAGRTKCISQSEAERILGEDAILTESTSENKDGILEYKCTYAAARDDSKTHKRGNLYYMFETYKSTASAHATYANIVESNRQQEGQRSLADVGDEAWFHTDQQNFYLILVRKNNKMLRIKVNKITSFTSETELRKVANDLVLEM